MKKYPLIDIAKIYCAVLVVLIHALEISEGHYWGHLFKSTLALQAVPFFFIASGFFFKKNWDKAQDKKKFALDYICHFLAFYGIWVLISAPEVLKMYLTKYPDGSFFYIALLVFRRVVFAGYSVFWYLLVTAEAALVVSVLLTKKKERLLYIMAGVGLILDLCYLSDINLPVLRGVNQLIYTIFSWNNNVLTKGLPFMAMGVYFADHCDKWVVKTKHLIIAYCAVFLANVVIFAGMYPIVDSPTRYMLLYPIQAVLLFLLAVSVDRVKIPEKIVRECRPISSAIYCLHCYFIYYVLNPTIGINANTFLRTVAATCLSVGLYWIVKKINFKPLIRLITLK